MAIRALPTLIALSFIGLSACSPGPIHHEHVADVPPTIRLTLIPQDTNTLVKLSGIESRTLITNDNLTQPLQLLLIDPTLTDFRLITPQKSNIPGIFTIPLMPKSNAPYRVWADIRPGEALSKKQREEFPSADLGARKIGNINKTQSLETNIDGHHFTLSFDHAPTADNESIATLHTDSAVASGDIYGFYDDFHSVIRLPIAPDGTFHLTPKKQGYLKLFAVIKQGYKTVTVPFGVVVAKAE